MDTTHLKPPLLALVVGTAGAVAGHGQTACAVQDLSYETHYDCPFFTWQELIWYNYAPYSGYAGLGSFSGANVCDPGGLNCDGSTRQSKLYKATKSLFSYPNYYQPDIAQFW